MPAFFTPSSTGSTVIQPENVAEEVPLTRRRVLGLLSGTLAVAASGRLLDAPGIDTDLPASTAASGASGGQFPDTIERRYRGTATTELPSAPFAPGAERPPVRHDVLVTVGPQSAPGGAPSATRNPFHLSIETAARDGPIPTGPGAVTSAAVTLDPDGRETTVDYWDVQSGNDGVFSGVLRNEDRSVNALTSYRELVPGRSETTLMVTEALVGGTTLRGTVTEDAMEIRMEGNTVNRFADDALDRTRPFVTVVRATREE